MPVRFDRFKKEKRFYLTDCNICFFYTYDYFVYCLSNSLFSRWLVLAVFSNDIITCSLLALVGFILHTTPSSFICYTNEIDYYYYFCPLWPILFIMSSTMTSDAYYIPTQVYCITKIL